MGRFYVLTDPRLSLMPSRGDTVTSCNFKAKANRPCKSSEIHLPIVSARGFCRPRASALAQCKEYLRRTFPKPCYFLFLNLRKTVLINFIRFNFVFQNKIICILQYLLGRLFTKIWTF